MQSDQTEHYFDLLRHQGCRITPVVTAMINLLFSTRAVRTPNQLRTEVSELLGYDVGFPTVYRILDRLLQAGIICSMHRSDGLMRYYLCRNPRGGAHHHFICSRCMQVQEVNLCLADRYQSFVEKKLDATITSHIIQLEGLCAECKR